jgi:signal transduction histidine kinase
MSAEKVIGTMTARWRRAGYPEFAWWIPLAMGSFSVGAGVVGAAQRAEQGALLPASLLMLVALTPQCLDLAGLRLPWPVFMGVTLSASAAVMVLYPVDYDFAMLVWVMLVGHVGATERLGASLLATTLAAAALGALTIGDLVEGSGFWLAALVVGGDIGVIMRYQQVRLDHERRTHRDHEAAAVLQERQRIAREVHDVIAHSLSVTMLHLTAARRSLEEDRDAGIDEAVDALRDAERLGRGAMADIRHTVGLLGEGSAQPTAAPDLRDLDRLVHEFRAAGLDIALDLRGDPASVPPNTCLSLYRIVQESLANIAKHQPGARATVALDCSPERQHLVVTNTLPTGARRPTGGGSGLRGMRERAELLGGTFAAGPRAGRWVVEVTLPDPDAPTARIPDCPLGLTKQQPSAEPA